MKKLYQIKFLLLFLTFIFSLHKAKPNDIELFPFQTIRAAGLGGAISCIPIGIESVIYNSAALKLTLPFSKKNWEIIINGNTYFQPKYLKPILEDVFETDNITSRVLINAKDLISKSGVGFNTSFVLGYTNKSFGCGLVSMASFFLQGAPFPLGTKGFGQIQLSIPFANSFIALESNYYKIAMGISLAPTVGIYKELDGKDVDAIAGGTETLDSIIFQAINHPYVSVPMDLGALFVFPNFINSPVELRISTVLDNLFGDYFVPGYNIRPITNSVSLNTGICFFIPYNIFGQSCYSLISAEIKSLNLIMSGNLGFWKALHIGTEFSINNFLQIQVGLSSGYPCVAAEIKVLALGFGILWETIESGKYIGDNPLSIFKVGVSINF